MLDQAIAYITELSTNHIYLFYGMLFLISGACSLGFPMNSDIIQITVSYLIYKGSVSYAVAAPVVILGILTGDVILYFLSRKAGQLSVQKIDPKTFNKVSQLINKYGAYSIFIARFLPGIRTVFIVAAGVMNLSFVKMLLADFLGAIIVIPAILYSVTFFAGNTEKMNLLLSSIQGVAIYVLAAVVLALIYLIYRIKRSKI